MFYEEKTIQNLLNCEQCSQRLDVPKKLSCGATICTKCEANLPVKSNQFECKLCSQSHTLDIAQGLPICKIISNLLTIKPNEISRGEAVESLKHNLSDLKLKIDKLIQNLTNGKEEIRRHCADLRVQIHNQTELTIKSINKMSKEFLDKIDHYESECLDSFEFNQHKQASFTSFVDELSSFNQEWTAYLTKSNIDESIIQEANTQAKELALKANEQSIRLEDLIFNGNFLKFEPNLNDLKHVLGRLETRDSFRSSILSNEEFKELMKLCKFSLNQKWKLLYRASRDGFGALDFHSRCDNFKSTLTIIKTTTGYVFGGYTDQDWSGKAFKIDPNAFIFSLINKDKKPIMLKCLNGYSAICCSPTCGVIFGNNSSCDILVADNSNKAKSSGSNLGSSYEHPVYQFDTDEANSFLAGAMYFQTVEIEVFYRV